MRKVCVDVSADKISIPAPRKVSVDKTPIPAPQKVSVDKIQIRGSAKS